MSLQECLPLTNVSLPVFSCQNVLRISIAASFLDLLLSKTRESGIMDNLRSETANNFVPPWAAGHRPEPHWHRAPRGLYKGDVVSWRVGQRGRWVGKGLDSQAGSPVNQKVR